MSIDLRRREALKLISGGAALCAGLSGCGTIFYPERIGQSHGPLDWKVVALDTVGLLLFLVPGVVAFVVDFHNGTVYLPPEEIPLHDAPVLSRKVSIEPEETDANEHRGRGDRQTALDLALTPGTFVTRELTTLADYPQASRELALDLNGGTRP